MITMENLIDYLTLAFLFMGLTAFFGAYALGMMTLRVAVNSVAAVFGVSTFALWVRRQKDKAFLPKAGPSLHYKESDEQKGHCAGLSLSLSVGSHSGGRSEHQCRRPGASTLRRQMATGLSGNPKKPGRAGPGRANLRPGFS